MNSRHDTIGIKQVIRLEWMRKTTNLMLAGLDEKSIRSELHAYLSEIAVAAATKSKDGVSARGRERSGGTRRFAVNNLINTWPAPDDDLVPFRDTALALLRGSSSSDAIGSGSDASKDMVVHWAMVSAAYPFWFNAACHCGRLLNLQSQVTQAQIVSRLKEQYGDRETVGRYARFVIRSFVAWGALKDSERIGCYEKATPMVVADPNLAVILVESILQSTPAGKGALGHILGSPSLFPFQLRPMTAEVIAQRARRVEVIRCGLDDEILSMKNL